jgi:hypothetical protein
MHTRLLVGYREWPSSYDCFAYSRVQLICGVFVLFVFVLCTLCCQFLWTVHCWMPLRYSLTFIYQQTIQYTKYLVFLFKPCYHWIGTSAVELLVPKEIIHPVISVSALTWFSRI